jgi:hypothetical protein
VSRIHPAVHESVFPGPKSQGGVRNKEEARAAVTGVPARYERMDVVTGQGLVDIAPFVTRGFYSGAAEARPSGLIRSNSKYHLSTTQKFRKKHLKIPKILIGV